jgi:small subunit ribosomal protein S6
LQGGVKTLPFGNILLLRGDLDTMIRPYEGIIFMKPSLSDAELNTCLGKIKNIIADMKGVIKEEKTPEKKKLPYIVRKNREGFYYFVKFEIESTVTDDLRKRLKIIEEVIKLTIAAAVPPPKPAPVEKKKEKPADAAAPAAPAAPEAPAGGEEAKA